MSKQLNINYQKLKTYISDARTEEVLSILEKELQGKTDYSAYLNEVIILSSTFSQLNSDRRIDILDPQQYTTKVNQINNAILDLLDDLKAGKSNPKIAQKTPATSNWKKINLVLFGLTFLLGVIGTATYYLWWQVDPKSPKVPTPSAKWECPTMDSNKFKVLVLPFHDDLIEGRTAPHKHIVDRLNAFTKSENIAAQIGRIQPDEDIKAISSESEATDFLEACRPDMLVWGLANMLEENTALTVSYSIYNQKPFEKISDFEPMGSVDTLLQEAYFSSSFKGATVQIEDVLQNLVSTLANFNEEKYAAIVAANTSSSGPLAPNRVDTSEVALYLAKMKAESFKKEKEVDRAIATYSNILEVKPTDELALNNRAQLNLQQKRYNEALVDFNTIDRLGKADYEVYYKKAEINERLGNLNEAKKGYSRAKSVSPPQMQSTIKVHLDQVEKKIKVEKDKISKSVNPIPAPVPTSLDTIAATNDNLVTKEAQLTSLLNQVKIQNAIGASKAAETSSLGILIKQPDNKAALRELIKAKYFQDSSVTISQLKKVPTLQRIDAATLRRLNDPICNSVIKNEELIRKKKKNKKRKQKQ